MESTWFYAEQDSRAGPVDIGTLRRLREAGTLTDETTVWKQGIASGMPLGAVLSLAASESEPERGFLASLGERISRVAGVDEIEDVPVKSVLSGNLAEKGPIEDVF